MAEGLRLEMESMVFLREYSGVNTNYAMGLVGLLLLAPLNATLVFTI